MIKGILCLENSCYPPRRNVFVVEVEAIVHTLDHVRYDCVYHGDSPINFGLYEMMRFSFSGKEYETCTLKNCEPWRYGKGLVLNILVPYKKEEKTMEHRRVATSYGNQAFEPSYRLDIKRIVVNGPATIVWWNDGTKTVVKISNDDGWDPYAAVAYALAKKHFGTNSAFKKKVMKKMEIQKKMKLFDPDVLFPKEDTNHDHA
nr:MAG TPA: hypothetical protein [Caudoviricetes sp.]